MLIFKFLIFAYLSRTASTAQGYNENLKSGANIIFHLDEELPIGTLVGSLTDKLGPKQSYSSGIYFTHLGQERYFRLNQTTGQLFIRSRIDREALCQQVGTCCVYSSYKSPISYTGVLEPDGLNSECALRLLVIDQRESKRSSQPQLLHVIFNIIDINDNPPEWFPDNLELEIPEHSPIGTMIQLPDAVDRDQDIESASVRYKLIPRVDGDTAFSNCDSRNIGDIFMLSASPTDESTDAVEKNNLLLKVNCDLDREQRDLYHLLLVAIDGSKKSSTFEDRTGTLNINIKVTDINDQVPYFTEEYPSVEVSEDVALGTRIFTMTAKDNDPSDASRLSYGFASTVSGEVMHLFRINEKDGTVIVASSLDYEVAPLIPEARSSNLIYHSQMGKRRDVGYIIPVKVTDGVHFAVTDLRVRLKNVNDNAPNIRVQSILPRWRNTNDLLLPEDTDVGTMVAVITIEDADERWLDNNNGGPYCETAHPFFAVQILYPNSRNQYMLVTSRLLDRETKSTHAVAIACHDSGQPVLSRGVNVVIHLEDLNDSPPIFGQSLYLFKVFENLEVNTIIGKIQATDADTGVNAAIRYTINSAVDLHDLIKLDPVSGQMHTAAIFDREKLESINFTVTATDCVGGTINKSNNDKSCSPVHSASTDVRIIIEDLNDCVPEFEKASYEFMVMEGQRPQQSVSLQYSLQRGTHHGISH